MSRLPFLALAAAMFAPSLPAADTLVATAPDILAPSDISLIVARPILEPKVEFAVINAPDADFLQSEFSGLPTGTGVRIDSVVVRPTPSVSLEAHANLEVHWRWAETGRDSLPPLSRRVQLLTPLKTPSVPTTGVSLFRSVLRVDSIWTCQNGRCVIAPAPRVVRNYVPIRTICVASCLFVDSAATAWDIRETIGKTGVALRLNPSVSTQPVSETGWIRATGDEDLDGLSVPLAGNLGNWIRFQTARFDVVPLAYTSAAKPSIPRSLDYKTGPASYTYDRTLNPNLKILEINDLRVVNDTLVKIGNTLMLTGNPKTLCGAPVVDTSVGRDSWFVLPDSSASAESIDRALSPSLCRARVAAWRMSGDTVWLGQDKWPVPVRELLALSGVKGDQPALAKPAVRLTGRSLELPFDATVATRDLAGRLLGTSRSLSAGTHQLDLAGHRGTFFVEIRALDARETRFLKGNAVGR